MSAPSIFVQNCLKKKVKKEVHIQENGEVRYSSIGTMLYCRTGEGRSGTEDKIFPPPFSQPSPSLLPTESQFFSYCPWGLKGGREGGVEGKERLTFARLLLLLWPFFIFSKESHVAFFSRGRAKKSRFSFRPWTQVGVLHVKGPSSSSSFLRPFLHCLHPSPFFFSPAPLFSRI